MHPSKKIILKSLEIIAVVIWLSTGNFAFANSSKLHSVKVISFASTTNSSCNVENLSNITGVHYGSGILVKAIGSSRNYKNLILTADHVLNHNPMTCQGILLDSGVFVPGKIIFSDYRHDIALLDVQQLPENLLPVELSESKHHLLPKERDQLLLVGFPVESKSISIYTADIKAIASPDAYYGSNNLIITKGTPKSSGKSEYGMSGGPAFNRAGDFIGMLVSHQWSQSENGYEFHSYILPRQHLANIVLGHLIHSTPVQTLRPSNQGQFQIELAGLYIEGPSAPIFTENVHAIGGGRGVGIGGGRGVGIGGGRGVGIGGGRGVGIGGSTDMSIHPVTIELSRNINFSDAPSLNPQVQHHLQNLSSQMTDARPYLVTQIKCNNKPMEVFDLRDFLAVLESTECQIEIKDRAIAKEKRALETSLLRQIQQNSNSKQVANEAELSQLFSTLTHDQYLKVYHSLNSVDQWLLIKLTRDFDHTSRLTKPYHQIIEQKLINLNAQIQKQDLDICDLSEIPFFALDSVKEHYSQIGLYDVKQRIESVLANAHASSLLKMSELLTTESPLKSICQPLSLKIQSGPRVEVFEVNRSCDLAKRVNVLLQVNHDAGRTLYVLRDSFTSKNLERTTLCTEIKSLGATSLPSSQWSIFLPEAVAVQSLESDTQAQSKLASIAQAIRRARASQAAVESLISEKLRNIAQ